ncbi:6329_t:CDS:2, partial [Entrophospora sp. SA101]
NGKGYNGKKRILSIIAEKLSSRELSKELENRGVDYGKQNKQQKLIEVLDEELKHETLASIEGSHLRNPSMSNKEEIRQLEASEFPLIIGWALKEVQKYGKKGCGKCMKKSIVLTLELKVEEGEIEISDLPKLSTIQGWITQYTAQKCPDKTW